MATWPHESTTLWITEEETVWLLKQLAGTGFAMHGTMGFGRFGLSVTKGEDISKRRDLQLLMDLRESLDSVTQSDGSGI
jgi:hypothetical protein